MSYIDVAMHTNASFNYRFAYYPGFRQDNEATYQLQYSDHTGGSASFVIHQFTNHHSPNGFGGWVRTNNQAGTFTYADTYQPSSTNWPGGWRVESGYTEVTGTAQDPRSVPKPPFLWSRFTGLTNFAIWTTTPNPPVFFTGAVTRAENTSIHLHTGAHRSNYLYKFVLLHSSAQRVDALSVQVPDPVLPDYMNASAVPPLQPTIELSWSNITILGDQLNADTATFKYLQPGATYDATPVVTGAANYFFNVAVVEHKLVHLTRAYHPLFELPPFTVPVPSISNLQAHFNNGSIMMGRDDDTKIPDNDPSAAYSDDAASVYRSDDVPAYIEFQIANGPIITNVLTRRLGPVFPEQFRRGRHYRVMDDAEADELLDWGGANIKLVKSLRYRNATADGLAVTPSSPPTMILLHTLPGTVGPHEWGHTQGLRHRGETVDGSIPNPGPTEGALMHIINHPDKPKVNRYERGVLGTF